MAITVSDEHGHGFDNLSASDVPTAFTSGSITAVVTGLRGEGQAIQTPTDLVKVGTPAGASEVIGHARLRYDQDDAYFFKVYTAAGDGPYLKITSGTVTAHRSDGTLLGTASSSWALGAVKTLSVAWTLASTAIGRVKVWFGSTAVIDVSLVQTMPALASISGRGMIMNGFGLWDDYLRIYGTGAWVDADVPLSKWIRTLRANAAGPVNHNQWNTYGSGSSHVDRVDETLANGDTDGIEYGGGNDGTVEGFKVEALPSNVSSVWTVLFEVQSRQVDGSLTRSLQLRTFDTSTHNNSGTFAQTLAFAQYQKSIRLNGSGSAWDSSSLAATTFEVTLTA